MFSTGHILAYIVM